MTDILTADAIKALIPKVEAGDLKALARILRDSPFLGGGGSDGGTNEKPTSAVIAAIVSDPALIQLAAAIWEVWASKAPGGRTGAVNASPFATAPKAAAANDPYPLNLLWDQAVELNLAGGDVVRTGRAGNYVPTIAGLEAARVAVPATWGGAVTVDLALGSHVSAALAANSTVTLFGNFRAGVRGRIFVTNSASRTVTFAAGAGVTLVALSDLVANTGAGALTVYEYETQPGAIYVNRVGGGVTAPGGNAPTLTTVTVTNDATAAGYGLWNTQFTVAENSAGETSLAYQWRMDGVDVSGATSAGYTPDRGALAGPGTGLTCLVTATNAYGSVSLESAPVTVLFAGWVPNSAASNANATSGSYTVTGYTPMSGQRFVQVAFGQASASGGPSFTLNGSAVGAGGAANVAGDVPVTNHRVTVNVVSDVTGSSFTSAFTAPSQTVSQGWFQLVGYDVSNDAAYVSTAVAASNATAGSLAINKGANAVMLAMAKGWELLTDVDLVQAGVGVGGTINNFWAAAVMSKLAADNTTIAVTTDTATSQKIAAAVCFAKA